MDTVLQTVADSIVLGSLYAIFALGISLIFGIMRLVNFAHGELIMLGAHSSVSCSAPCVARHRRPCS
jgi:branched-chain amino acid transport system permease protein